MDNDYRAEVSTTGNTLRNEDIAARIVAARPELRLETIVSIFSAHDEIARDKIARDALAQVAAMQDGCAREAPRVSGNWLGASHAFDPAIHKRGLDVSPIAEMRSVLETVGVEALGEKNSGAYIGMVTDAAKAQDFLPPAVAAGLQAVLTRQPARSCNSQEPLASRRSRCNWRRQPR